MKIATHLISATAATLICLAAGEARSAITVYTSEAEFLAAVGAAGTDTFDDLVAQTPLDGPLQRQAGSFAYNVGAGPLDSTLGGVGSGPDIWLSTNESTDGLTFSGFSSSVNAAGTGAFGTDFDGAFLASGSITVTATDAGGAVSRTFAPAGRGTFVGFVSDRALLSISVKSSPGAAADVWPTVNDFVLATPVPEPGPSALWVAGLAALGLAARRRDRR